MINLVYFNPKYDKFTLQVFSYSRTCLNIEDLSHLKVECHNVKRLLHCKSPKLESVTESMQFLTLYKDVFFQLLKKLSTLKNSPIFGPTLHNVYFHRIQTYTVGHKKRHFYFLDNSNIDRFS